jgi:site-specific recombinase XerD
MFEKIYLKESNLRKHLGFPLQKEREAFLVQMEEKGACLRYLQMSSAYLLFAVQALHLKDDNKEVVSFESIQATGHEWKRKKLSNSRRINTGESVETKTKEFVSTTVKWLSEIGRINPLFMDENLIFNRFNKMSARLKYLCAPFFDERRAYLNHLEVNGMKHSTLREYSVYQLHIIDFMNITTLRRFSESEILTAARKWHAIGNENRPKDTMRRYNTFRAVAFGWFKYSGLFHSDKPDIAESEKLDEYYNWILNDKGLSMETVKKRKLELEQFATYISLESYDLKSLNAACLDGYIEKRHNDGCSRRTIATIMTTLKDFLRFAFSQKWMQAELSGLLKSPRLFSFETLPLSPTWMDVQRLVNYYDGNKPSDIRNKAIMIIFAVYGIRCSEMENLTLKDIDWKNDIIYLRRAKRCHSQLLPLLPVVGNALARYVKEIRRNDLNREYLFLDLVAPFTKIKHATLYRIVASACKALDIQLKHVGPHSLRHACAGRLVNSGHSLKEVSDLLGHKQLDTTMVYAKIDMVNLRRVAEMNWEGLL